VLQTRFFLLNLLTIEGNYMCKYTITELKAQLDAINKRIANHEPLAHSAAINKVRAYATEHGMTEDDLFPVQIDPYADQYSDLGCDPGPDPDYTDFSEFIYDDTFGYTFIKDLKQQRDEIDAEISCLLRAIRCEAIERARAFIREYNLTKKDIYPTPCQAK
jgi:hypothetical protein